MQKIIIIGIGAGDPDYMTVQAINALNKVDVFFIPNKGAEKAALQRLRVEICERFIENRTYRFVEVEMPERAKEFSDYRSNVTDWHAQIEESYVKFLTNELGEGECGAIPVTGGLDIAARMADIAEQEQAAKIVRGLCQHGVQRVGGPVPVPGAGPVEGGLF